jgi:hypothetical protein
VSIRAFLGKLLALTRLFRVRLLLGIGFGVPAGLAALPLALAFGLPVS